MLCCVLTHRTELPVDTVFWKEVLRPSPGWRNQVQFRLCLDVITSAWRWRQHIPSKSYMVPWPWSLYGSVYLTTLSVAQTDYCTAKFGRMWLWPYLWVVSRSNWGKTRTNRCYFTYLATGSSSYESWLTSFCWLSVPFSATDSTAFRRRHVQDDV